MKCDQIAYYCIDEGAELAVKKFLGLEKAQWLPDTVTASSKVLGEPLHKNVAQLQFNYDLGIEIEILRYIEGPHWHLFNADYAYAQFKDKEGKVMPFVSHVGYHVDEFPPAIGGKLVQETWTESHTAEYLTTGAGAGRKYHYRIYELGVTYQKFIKRINP